jgi:hypothetical protein
MLVIVCLAFFSFREVGQCNVESCLKKSMTKKVIRENAEEEWNFSPLYNFLKI